MSEYMIMLNDQCNLNCPYCFAKETMNHTKGEMTLKNFNLAVDFGLRKKLLNGIGIIGGEPTLHSKFDELIDFLICDLRVNSIDIFTNGTTIIDHSHVFLNKKCHTLINLNDPSISGSHNFSKMIQGIDYLFRKGIQISNIGFGINIYESPQNISDILHLVDQYKMDTIRVSVSVPVIFQGGGKQRFSFFEKYLEQTKLLVRELFDRAIIPIFDCNKIPPCMLKEEETLLYRRYINKPDCWSAVLKSNYLNGLSRCTPSIVVDQELYAIRCFAVSDISRVSIQNFEDLDHLIEYYEKNIDIIGYREDCIDCRECYSILNKECMGGCLMFKKFL